MPTAWNKGPMWQGGMLASQAIQERVHKLFGMDYSRRNWRWLLDPARLRCLRRL